FLRRPQPLEISEESDPLMTVRDEMRDGHFRSESVIRDDRVDVDRARAIEEDDRRPGEPTIRVQQTRPDPGRYDYQTVYLVRGEFRDQLSLPRGLPVGAPDEHQHPT